MFIAVCQELELLVKIRPVQEGLWSTLHLLYYWTLLVAVESINHGDNSSGEEYQVGTEGKISE